MENGQILGVYSMRDLNVKEIHQITGGQMDMLGNPPSVLPSPIELDGDLSEYKSRRDYNAKMLNSNVFNNAASRSRVYYSFSL